MDAIGYGFGGTGKKSNKRNFETYGKPFQLNDTVGFVVVVSGCVCCVCCVWVGKVEESGKNLGGVVVWLCGCVVVVVWLCGCGWEKDGKNCNSQISNCKLLMNK